MVVEIERKFLVVGEFKQQATSFTHIVQGYICSERGRTVRIRLRGDKGYITIKGPSNVGGLARCEFETEIAVADAQDLLRLCEPGVIDKNRYLVPSGKHTFEVDEFFGENQGLIMAEVELGASDEPYEKPDFIGLEVTGDRRFYNSQLRRNPFSVWGEQYKTELSQT
ncbi:MAG: CYTH domain-containing protein [Bacteroidaceae bacterium]